MTKTYDGEVRFWTDGIDDTMRQSLIDHTVPEDKVTFYLGWREEERGVAGLQFSYIDIELNVDAICGHGLEGWYVICVKHANGNWETDDLLDDKCSIDWSSDNWKDLLKEEMHDRLMQYVARMGYDIDSPIG